MWENQYEKTYMKKTLLNSFNQFTNRKLLCIILLKPDSAGPSYIEPKIFAQSLMIYVNILLKPYNKFTKDDLIGIDVGDLQTGILKN